MKSAALAMIALFACRGGLSVASGEPGLKLNSGRWMFQGKTLTGTITESLPDATRITNYREGLEDGEQTATSTTTGIMTEQRYYKAGKKHGVHRGWFADGKDRFYSEFAEDRYVGEHWTWHSNGKVAEFKKYTPDGQILVHKHWRESGQIYRNQVFTTHNSESGLPGVKLCNTVKDTVGGRTQ